MILWLLVVVVKKDGIALHGSWVFFTLVEEA